MPAGPRYVAAAPGVVVATSVTAGTVTVLRGAPARVAGTLEGFTTPQLVALAPGNQRAYVTDDAAGTLTAISLTGRPRRLWTVYVGAGAHHLAVSPDGRHVWVALGETAHTIVLVGIGRGGAPRVTGRLRIDQAVHDLEWSPDGRTVWVSSADGSDVLVFDAGDQRQLFAVAVGRGPQHVAFAGRYAYLTSGYAGRIERVDVATGRIEATAATPYGSFELDAGDGYVATASLLDGRLAVFAPGLRRLHVTGIAPATRDVSISAP